MTLRDEGNVVEVPTSWAGALRRGVRRRASALPHPGDTIMMENTLVRTGPCVECGADMLWTQNAWAEGEIYGAAYRCVNGHVIDPAMTRQCPGCGVHDTTLTSAENGRQQYKCLRCGESFQVPR